MTIYLGCALAMVVLVAASVFRARAAGVETPKFPWFWVFFPLLSFSLVGACVAFQEMTTFDYGWTMMSPEQIETYSSELQPDLFGLRNFQGLSFIFALFGVVVGALGSILSWRKQRI
ncbi:hypothetical protein SFC07_05040 [Corynebacterium callunae]|uniref:hypothetical protein n=1 Tax=Corynebacterium callunae TaxID=1721 RepID=UPI0039826DDF